jgi:hypothetical protein
VGQTCAGGARARQTLTYTISVQNDGAITDGYLVQGQPSTNWFRVTYRNAAGVNITRQVTDGTYRLRQMAPGELRRLTASVLVRPAAPVGTTLTRAVTVTAHRSADFQDVVRLVARRA